jgi:hypothetical protein
MSSHDHRVHIFITRRLDLISSSNTKLDRGLRVETSYYRTEATETAGKY